MRALEDWYWWFVARRSAALRFLDDYLPRDGTSRILDAGCGTGALLDALRAQPGREAVGLDFAEAALQFCRERGYERLVRGDLEALPFAEARFDAVTALDVIEHVPDDAAAAREIARALKPGGILVASVPAYPFLWSGHDVALHHQRRYYRAEMVRLLENAGLRVERSTYLLTALFPVAAVQRLLARLFRRAARAGLPPVPAWLNRALIALQHAELSLSRRVNLPWGLTIMVVARKPGES